MASKFTVKISTSLPKEIGIGSKLKIVAIEENEVTFMNLDISSFQELLNKCKYLTILTGAGVSAESGIPTFRGEGGLWRTYASQDLSSPDTWHRDPGLLWEFFNYRRQVVSDKKPNPAHYAIAAIEKRFKEQNKKFMLITQNIDDLHITAGSRNLVRLHGSLWQVRCCSCGEISNNHDLPITPSYEGSGSPDPDAPNKKFSIEDLPKCKSCKDGILRPHVVWFGEQLDPLNISVATKATENCEIFMVVGTSSVVYPAAGLAVQAQQQGAKVVVVNLDPTPANAIGDFVFQGKAGELLPSVLGVEEEIPHES